MMNGARGEVCAARRKVIPSLRVLYKGTVTMDNEKDHRLRASNARLETAAHSKSSVIQPTIGIKMADAVSRDFQVARHRAIRVHWRPFAVAGRLDRLKSA